MKNTMNLNQEVEITQKKKKSTPHNKIWSFQNFQSFLGCALDITDLISYNHTFQVTKTIIRIGATITTQ